MQIDVHFTQFQLKFSHVVHILAVSSVVNNQYLRKGQHDENDEQKKQQNRRDISPFEHLQLPNSTYLLQLTRIIILLNHLYWKNFKKPFTSIIFASGRVQHCIICFWNNCRNKFCQTSQNIFINKNSNYYIMSWTHISRWIYKDCCFTVLVQKVPCQNSIPVIYNNNNLVWWHCHRVAPYKM